MHLSSRSSLHSEFLDPEDFSESVVMTSELDYDEVLERHLELTQLIARLERELLELTSRPSVAPARPYLVPNRPPR